MFTVNKNFSLFLHGTTAA